MRPLITEIYDHVEGLNYKRHDIGVYLYNVIGYKNDSKNYVAKIKDPNGDLNESTQKRTFTFQNRFSEDLFNIIIDDIHRVRFQEQNAPILLAGSFNADLRDSARDKYVSLDDAIAMQDSNLYVDDEVYIGATKTIVELDSAYRPTVKKDGDYKFTKTGATFNKAVEFKEAVTMQGALNANDDLVVEKDLTVKGDTTLKGTLDVTKETTLKNTLTVEGNTTLEKNLEVKENTTLDKNLQVKGDTDLDGKLDVAKETVLNNTLEVKENTTLDKVLWVKDNITGDKNLWIKGDTDLDGKLDAAKETVLNDTLEVKKATTLDDTLEVKKDTTLDENLTVKKDVTVKENLTVDKNTTLNSDIKAVKVVVPIYDDQGNEIGSEEKYMMISNGNQITYNFTDNIFNGNIIPGKEGLTLGSSSIQFEKIYAESIVGEVEGTSATAAQLETARNIKISGINNTSVTKLFDGSADIDLNLSGLEFNAAKLTAGTIDIERLPKAALDRLVPVPDEVARLALTVEQVQIGDTVQQEDTKKMYYVVDESKLGNADPNIAKQAFKEYTVGAASAVPWEGVTGKPTWTTDPKMLTVNQGSSLSTEFNIKANKTVNIKTLSITLPGSETENVAASTTKYDTAADKSITFSPQTVGAAPEKGSKYIEIVSNHLQLGDTTNEGDSYIIKKYPDGTETKLVFTTEMINGSTEKVIKFVEHDTVLQTEKEIVKITESNGIEVEKVTGAEIQGTSETAKKLEVDDTGSKTKFVYFKDGVPVATDSTLGSSGLKSLYMQSGEIKESSQSLGAANKLIYIENGQFKASGSNIGSSIKPMYMSAGVLTAFSETIGSKTKPVYMKNGEILETETGLDDYLPLKGGTMKSGANIAFEKMPSTQTRQNLFVMNSKSTNDVMYDLTIEESSTRVERSENITASTPVFSWQFNGNDFMTLSQYNYASGVKGAQLDLTNGLINAKKANISEQLIIPVYTTDPTNPPEGAIWISKS